MRAPVNVEAVAVASLASLPGGVRVATKVPNPRPESFVRVGTVSGGIPATMVEAPLVLVECWAREPLAAFDLARHAWARLVDIEKTFVAGAWVLSVDATRPVNFPDPLTSSARYQFTATIRVALEDIA